MRPPSSTLAAAGSGEFLPPPEVATADSYAERRRDGTAGPNLDVKRADGRRHETEGRSEGGREGGRAEVDRRRSSESAPQARMNGILTNVEGAARVREREKGERK